MPKLPSEYWCLHPQAEAFLTLKLVKACHRNGGECRDTWLARCWEYVVIACSVPNRTSYHPSKAQGTTCMTVERMEEPETWRRTETSCHLASITHDVASAVIFSWPLGHLPRCCTKLHQSAVDPRPGKDPSGPTHPWWTTRYGQAQWGASVLFSHILTNEPTRLQEIVPNPGPHVSPGYT